MRSKAKKYILCQENPKYVWYLVDVFYNDNPESDWVLDSSCCQLKSKAKVFNNFHKAERVAAIIGNQSDEMGGVSQYKVRELK